MGGLTAGTVMAEGTFSLCERRLRAKVGYCVPAQVPPFSEAPTFDLHLTGRPSFFGRAYSAGPLVKHAFAAQERLNLFGPVK